MKQKLYSNLDIWFTKKVKKQINFSYIVFGVIPFLTLIFSIGYHLRHLGQIESIEAPQHVAGSIPPAAEEEFPLKIEKNQTLSEALRKVGFSGSDVQGIVLSAKALRNLNMLRAGTKFKVEVSELGPVMVKFKFSAVEHLEISRANGEWSASQVIEDIKTEFVTFSSAVETSLWESAQKASMDPQLIAALTEIFAWQIDFAREVRPTDRWRLTVEKKFVKERHVGWGDIIAAEYQTNSETYQAFLHRIKGDTRGYFGVDGKSLRRMFLKSPIPFGHVTSRFQMNRFHPIFKDRRPHLGVDYGAPYGTAIRSVGDGVVESVGWKGGGGKAIIVRHNSVYKTAYKHLSNFVLNIRSGSRVKQGQVIGYVGQTGTATGPHLHFEFWQSGRYVDPLGKNFPSADPVPKTEFVAFREEAKKAELLLPPWP